VVVERTSSTSSQLELFDRVLDRGIVIDAWMRVQLIGLDLLTIEALVVLASLPRYLESSESLGLAGLPPPRGARRHAVTSTNLIDGISPKAHKNRRTRTGAPHRQNVTPTMRLTLPGCALSESPSIERRGLTPCGRLSPAQGR